MNVTETLIIVNFLLSTARDLWKTIAETKGDMEIPSWEEIVRGQADLGKLIEEMKQRA